MTGLTMPPQRGERKKMNRVNQRNEGHEDDWFDDAPAAGGEKEDEPRESEERRLQLQQKRKEHATSVDLVKKRPSVLDNIMAG
eukprot:CAMPEP_0201739856 /NCGR_PEP_ID=MMETSP0593-20130828/46002_1 /ASSEMBLY_ACC=CAM_ASM_000672 /TAXON_ID=267983 /ORGANISM="Skeletonema japonicum, Strain CCMP2506" /LENGTH=82 /DNA_ID=CAMNT_0048234151 /DNA_START=480 /DNA_END=729 /DNA_ORIENTATION=-